MPLTGDGYLAGEYPGGTTTVEGAPVSAAVLVYQRDSGQLIAQTESSQSGEWIVTGVDLSKAHDIVGRKEGFNDVIVSNVMPTSMVDITYTGDITNNETFTGALGYLELVGGIPPYAASVVDPLPAGIFPVVNGRQLIIDGTTTDDDVFNSTVRITSSNGATKDVPVKLAVGFKAPANLEAETLEDAGAFSVVLTWGVTNSTQEVLVFKSATPFDLESMPAPIATLTGDAISYTDDDVIEYDEFYYMTASVCEGFTLYSDEVEEVVTVGDPHWDNVVSLLHFDGDLEDKVGKSWQVLSGTPQYEDSPYGSALNTSSCHIGADFAEWNDFKYGTGDFTIECWVKQTSANINNAIFNHEHPPTVQITAAFGLMGQADIIGMGLYNGYWQYVSSTWMPVTGVWHHIAVSRTGSTYRLFADGVQVSQLVSSQIITAASKFLIGRRFNTATSQPYFQGLISEFRITKGVARYTANFTPPTEPFPNK